MRNTQTQTLWPIFIRCDDQCGRIGKYRAKVKKIAEAIRILTWKKQGRIFILLFQIKNFNLCSLHKSCGAELDEPWLKVKEIALMVRP